MSDTLRRFDEERTELNTALECARARLIAGDIDTALGHVGDAQNALGRIEELLESEQS